MKKLIALLVVLALLTICSASQGYILVYKMTSTVKCVYEDVNTVGNVKIKGVLAVDIDDSSQTAVDMQMVLYGKNVDANLIYYVEDFSGNADLAWVEEGAYLTLYLTNHREQFYYDVWLTGKIKQKNVGLGDDDLKNAPSSLKGSWASTSGLLLDDSQSMFGSGKVSLTFDKTRTINANTLSSEVAEVITAVVNELIDKQYEQSEIP